MTEKETNELIIDALILLMKEKSLEEITITEIVKRAGVGRGTFYRHFKDKEEVIKKYVEYNIEDFSNKRKGKIESKEEYYEVFFSLFMMLKNNKDAVKILIKADLASYYFDFLLKGIEKASDAEAKSDTILSRYYPSFVAGALYGITVKWAEHDFAEPVKEIADIFYGLFPFAK